MAYIKLEDAINHIKNHTPVSCSADFFEGQMDCIGQLESLPTADVEEVKHGRWHTARKTKLSKTVQCTACDMDFYFKVKGQLNIDMCPRYPNCGAKMDGGKEDV